MNIQWVIDRLNECRNRKSNNEKFELEATVNKKIKDIISIIADNIVRNKLYEIYWELTGDQGAVIDEISLLEQRIINLKRRTNDSDQ